MKILEFNFNQNSAPDFLLFWKKNWDFYESFCYSPTDKDEEKFGNLFLLGELKNASKKQNWLIEEIAEVIKQEYYSQKEKDPEESFREALLKANKILQKELPFFNNAYFSFSALAIFSDLSSSFSKIGESKIFLFRQQEMFNIGDNSSLNSSGERIFSNIIQGKFEENDKLLILNEGLFLKFWENKFFKNFRPMENKKEIKTFFESKRTVLKSFSGSLIFVFVRKNKKIMDLSFLSKIKMPIIKFLKIKFLRIRLLKIHFSMSDKLKKIFGTNPFSPQFSSIKANFHSFKNIKEKMIPESPHVRQKLKKGIVCLAVLIVLLLIGYFIF